MMTRVLLLPFLLCCAAATVSAASRFRSQALLRTKSEAPYSGKCAYDYGSKDGTPACCGQSAKGAGAWHSGSAKVTCPQDKPICKGFVNGVSMGACESAPPPTTESPPNEVTVDPIPEPSNKPTNEPTLDPPTPEPTTKHPTKKPTPVPTAAPTKFVQVFDVEPNRDVKMVVGQIWKSDSICKKITNECNGKSGDCWNKVKATKVVCPKPMPPPGTEEREGANLEEGDLYQGDIDLSFAAAVARRE